MDNLLDLALVLLFVLILPELVQLEVFRRLQGGWRGLDHELVLHDVSDRAESSSLERHLDLDALARCDDTRDGLDQEELGRGSLDLVSEVLSLQDGTQFHDGLAVAEGQSALRRHL